MIKLIPDELKQHAIDLQNIVGLLYTGFPPDTSRDTTVSTKQLQRLKHLEKKLRGYMTDELGLFWETEYLALKKQSKRTGE